MKRVALVLGVLVAFSSLTTFAATRCRITNKSSTGRTVEIRKGVKDDCNSNPLWATRGIAGNAYIDVPLSGETKICARYQTSTDSWSTWYVTGCPSENNDLCYINVH